MRVSEILERSFLAGACAIILAACGSSSKPTSPVKCASSEAGWRAGGLLRALALVALLGCLCLPVAGCGGSSAPISQQQEVSSYVAFAACLNKHGVQVEAARTGGLVWVTAAMRTSPRAATETPH